MPNGTLKWTARAVALLAAAGVVYAGWTASWPQFFVVRNEAEDARCDVAFSNGFTWSVGLRHREENFWFFAGGVPDAAHAICRSPARLFEAGWGGWDGCGPRNRDADTSPLLKTFHFEVGSDPREEQFCIMS